MKVEIAIPCYNEEQTIGKVISDFHNAIAGAEIVVYDNDSTDKTVERAKNFGASIVPVNMRGKGYVLQAIFETSKADIVVIVDGDDTYEAGDVSLLIEPLLSGKAEMAIGTRLGYHQRMEFRKVHFAGNKIITNIFNFIFKAGYTDILSGYRAFTRKFIQRVPIISMGFEIETELMIQALESGMSIKEVPIRFRKRPSGSISKLSTLSDGYRILINIVCMLRDHRPLFAFSVIGTFMGITGAAFWFFGFFYLTRNRWAMFLKELGGLFIVSALGLFLVGLTVNTINVRMRELFSLLRRK